MIARAVCGAYYRSRPRNEMASAGGADVPTWSDEALIGVKFTAYLKIVGCYFCYTPPPIPKARTRFGLFHVCPQRQFWRDFADLPRERHSSHPRAFGPPLPLCSLLFSGGLASVREATSCIDADFEEVGCGWQLLGRKRLIKNLENFSLHRASTFWSDLPHPADCNPSRIKSRYSAR